MTTQLTNKTKGEAGARRAKRGLQARRERFTEITPGRCYLLKKIGIKCRRCSLVPGKAMGDEKQLQAQQEFHEKQLQPTLDEAKQGKRTVLFVDAAHFVMAAFFRDGLELRASLAAVCHRAQTPQCLGCP